LEPTTVSIQFAKFRLLAGLLPVLALTAGTRPAVADDLLNQPMEQPSATDFPSTGPWNVTLGLGGGYAPKFEGADRYHAVPIPYVAISYAGLGAVGSDGFNADVIHSGGFRAGPLISYSAGRDQSDDPHLHGLGDISAAILMGGFAAYRWGDFEVRAQVRQAVSHAGNGLDGSLGATYALHPSSAWTIKAGPQLVFADGDYMKKYFGVTAVQSQNSGLKAYSAGGGIKNVAFGVNSTYQLSQHWLLFGLAKVSEIVGDAADSPIVQSKDQYFAGLGVAYHF
jgi:outer membrane scaffolding protein for murein synthesis (MipA/OmpV family)